jgi:uncharacterized membrane protein (DUF106 family)
LTILLPSITINGCSRFVQTALQGKKNLRRKQKHIGKRYSEEEFNAMYVDFEQFDELEEEYFDMEEEQLRIISTYVKEHLSDFVDIGN